MASAALSFPPDRLSTCRTTSGGGAVAVDGTSARLIGTAPGSVVIDCWRLWPRQPLLRSTPSTGVEPTRPAAHGGPVAEARRTTLRHAKGRRHPFAAQ